MNGIRNELSVELKVPWSSFMILCRSLNFGPNGFNGHIFTPFSVSMTSTSSRNFSPNFVMSSSFIAL